MSCDDTGDTDTGCLDRQDLIDLFLCKPALEFLADLIEQADIHLMIQKAVDLQYISFFYYAILQDAFLFDDTFLQNVTLYRPELAGRVEPVMRSLGMDAFLASHDLDQPFQNTKGNLSGGEKQKLALGI